jgi:serine/threonine protein kinase
VRRTRRIGRYHLTDRVAFGGMAEVFRGFTFDQEGVRYDVAIKKLLPHYVEDTHFVTMLTDEYRLVSRLHHPNIAHVYELVDIDKQLLIAMEYVDGKDLRSTVEKARKTRMAMTFADIAYVMARALDGLHHAHNAMDDEGQKLGVVHRDFSPSNVLIGYDGDVKICDFGIAKAKLNRVQTQTGIIKGKVKYMSPEQAFGDPLDHRSDVFSAGSVLYELCTGQAPFKARSELDLIFAVRDARFPEPRTLNPAIPQVMIDIVTRAMAKERDERFQSALEFRDCLIRFLREFAPKYRRTRLARFMKHIWQNEIDEDLRMLEDCVIDFSDDAGEYGNNLLAADLPADAPYATFSPSPAGAAPAPLEQARTTRKLN